MTDPTPVSALLDAARKALGAGPEISATGPDDHEDPAEIEAANALGVERARALRWARVAPARFADATLADFEGRPFAPDLAAWANNAGGRNLVLFGPVGVGKSRAALAACRVPHDAGLEVRYLLVAEALDLLRPGGPDGALDDLSAVDRLILDDLGSERPTDWTAERLGILLDRRWRDELPTALTTNLELHQDETRNDLRAALGARSYSRVVGDEALILRLTGPDRRLHR